MSPLSQPAKSTTAKPATAQIPRVPIPTGEERHIKGTITGRADNGVFVTITNPCYGVQMAAHKIKRDAALAADPDAKVPPPVFLQAKETVFIAPFTDSFARSVDIVCTANALTKPFTGSEVRTLAKKP